MLRPMSELQPVENYLEYGDVIDNIIITTDDDGDSDGDDGDDDDGDDDADGGDDHLLAISQS